MILPFLDSRGRLPLQFGWFCIARYAFGQVGTTFLFNFAFCIFRPRTNVSVARLEDSIPYILVRHNDLYPLSYGDADFKKTLGKSFKSSFADLKVSCAQAFSFGASVARGVLI